MALAVHGMGATVSDTLTPLAVGALLVALQWKNFLTLQFIPALFAGYVVWRRIAVLGDMLELGEEGPAEHRSLAIDVSAAADCLLACGPLMKELFSAEESNASRSTQIREILQLARHPVFLGISAAKGLAMMGRLVVMTFLPIYLQEHLGYSPFALGFFVALLHAMGTISQPVLGVMSDRFGRKVVLFPSFILQGALFMLLGVIPAGLALSIVIAANGLFFYTLMNITYAAVLDVAGANIQASSYGLASLVTEIVVVPTPIAA